MKLWQCQIESDKEGGEENETEHIEEEVETEEESGVEDDEGRTDEEGGEEDESEEDREERQKETEENVGDDNREEEEEDEDAEIFGYEKIEKSEIEQLDCSSMRNRLEHQYSIMFISIDLNQNHNCLSGLMQLAAALNKCAKRKKLIRLL